MKKNCTVCDTEFETHHPLYKFCSQVCQKINTRQRDNNRYRKKNPLQEQKRTCNFCDIEFETLYPNQIKYCGDECRKQKKLQRGDIYRIENRQAINQYSRDKRKKDKLNLPPEKKNCAICDTEFESNHSLYKTCSRACGKINTKRKKALRYSEKQLLKPVMVKNCIVCDESFSPLNTSNVYCGEQCRTLASRKRLAALRGGWSKYNDQNSIKKCVECGDNFEQKSKQRVTCYNSTCHSDRHKRLQQEKYMRYKSSKPSKPPKVCQCYICKNDFESNSPNHKICSDKCRQINSRIQQRNKRSLLPPTIKNCGVCGEGFEVTTSGKYCSDKCRKEHNREYMKNYSTKNPVITKTCPQCKNDFQTTYHKKQIFCQKKCTRKHHDAIPKRAISRRIRNQINRCIRRNKMNKNNKTFALLGYTKDELKVHLESYFTEENGYTWDNMHLWHIDHIRPVASFDFDSTDHPEFKECWALKNLQPLWAKDNISKNAKWNGVDYKGVKA